MTIYVVNYKETTIGEDNELNVKSGICDFGYRNEKDAIEKVAELANDAKRQFVDEFGYEEDDIEVERNNNGDFMCVTCGSNTFEYFVTNLEIM